VNQSGTARLAGEFFLCDEAEVSSMSSGIESQIAALIAASLQVDESTIRRDMSFVTDLGADSLACVVLILAIEDEFQVDIHDEDAAELLTVGHMIEYVSSALALEQGEIDRRVNSTSGAESHRRRA
jgi:acyl carrier protein